MYVYIYIYMRILSCERAYMHACMQLPMVIAGFSILSGLYSSVRNARKAAVKVWHQPVSKNPNDPTTVVSTCVCVSALCVFMYVCAHVYVCLYIHMSMCLFVCVCARARIYAEQKSKFGISRL